MKPQINIKTYKRFKIPASSLLLTCTLIAMTFSLLSCKKFLNIPPPPTQIVTTSVFDNDASAISAQTTIYATMFAYGESYSMSVNMGTYSDELQSYSQYPAQIQYYTNALLPTSTSWNNYYNYIYQANAVIEGLQTHTGVSTAVKQQLTGEA